MVETSIGDLVVVCNDHGLTGLYFREHRYPPSPQELGKPSRIQDDVLLANTLLQLEEYFEGIRTDFSLPLSPKGDEFSNRVWQMLLRIPYGTTTTYGTIARELGNPYLAQRVGQAVGHNPISIIIPCHRVLGSDGSLTGYVGGLEIKRQLLVLEEPVAESANRLF